MSFIIILRLVIMLIVALLGWEVGSIIAMFPGLKIPLPKGYYQFIMTALGALLGFLVAPYLTIIPYRAVREKLNRVPARSLTMGVVGMVVGLVVAALLALPLSLLPGIFGQVLPFVVAVAASALGAATMITRDRELLALLGLFVSKDKVRPKRELVLLDTSVIIDGRMADICQTGFIRGTMIVPRVVLDELQHIADSPDVLRRNRGRRGLDILNKMQKDEHILLEISEMDISEIREVDAKLIKLAQDMDCPILTNDYNLNRVAELQGVEVLNINELANAVKAVVLPGESLSVRVIQEGKELGQGVGYLDDGTMVVIEDGRRHINHTVDISVTRVLQTVAGRMIFGSLPSKHSEQ